MYELKRSSKIQEEVKIGDEVIKVDVSIDDIAGSFNKYQKELTESAQRLLSLREQGITNQNLNDAFQLYGSTITSLLRLVFGADDTEKIIKFYESRYTEIADQVIPYVMETFLPKIQAAVKKQKGKIKQQYTAIGLTNSR